jgi:hypothetical protein
MTQTNTSTITETQAMLQEYILDLKKVHANPDTMLSFSKLAWELSDFSDKEIQPIFDFFFPSHSDRDKEVIISLLHEHYTGFVFTRIADTALFIKKK